MWCLIVEEGRGEVRVRELKNWQIIFLIRKIRKIQVRNIKKNRNVSKNHLYNQKFKIISRKKFPKRKNFS